MRRRPAPRSWRRSLALVVVAAIGAACDAADAGDAPIGEIRTAYREAADARCLAAMDELVALGADTVATDDPEPVAAKLVVLVAMEADLRRLAPPPGDEHVVTALLDELVGALAVLGSEPDRYGQRDRDPLEAVRVRAQDYGFRVCGQREADLG